MIQSTDQAAFRPSNIKNNIGWDAGVDIERRFLSLCQMMPNHYVDHFANVKGVALLIFIRCIASASIFRKGKQAIDDAREAATSV